ncbi:hypothetical protein N802_08470 [Knoellia sinensis KCTC 19936]|uniref:DUF4386 family protein n=1 Tax=Knoellia sinensis KCTC 19936 TaxID=1385520 RepID=A0A0A0J977_9MICO|nr:hypothetical protein [Knoellia sinensis]KGN33970.1 hypothetical protein N802_08470 [Knoellia sinensis KCTC 19936]
MSTATSVSATEATPGTGIARRRSLHRTGALAGLAWLVAAFGATTPEGPVTGNATVAEIRNYAAVNTGTLTVNALSGLIGVIALLTLVGVLAELVGSVRSRNLAARFVTLAGALAAVQMLFFASVYSAWVLQPITALSDSAVQTLFNVGLVADMLGTLTLVVTCSMVGLVSLIALRDRFLSRPVALLGLVIAGAEFVTIPLLVMGSDAAQVPLHVALFGWFFWPVIVGADLGVRAFRSRHA